MHINLSRRPATSVKKARRKKSDHRKLTRWLSRRRKAASGIGPTPRNLSVIIRCNQPPSSHRQVLNPMHKCNYLSLPPLSCVYVPTRLVSRLSLSFLLSFNNKILSFPRSILITRTSLMNVNSCPVRCMRVGSMGWHSLNGSLDALTRPMRRCPPDS